MSKDSALTKIELNPSDANVMVRFVGELNENLKFVEKTFNVKIFQNGNNLKIQGSQKDVNQRKLKILIELGSQQATPMNSRMILLKFMIEFLN